MTSLLSEITLEVRESLTRRALLGIRFWDPALDQEVSDALSVRARRADGLGPERRAQRSLSGVYALRDLPSLGEVERGEEEGVAESTRFVVNVDDPRKRYLPTAFHVDLPLPYRGVWDPTFGLSPPGAGEPRSYLFSAPSRPRPSGLALIRAQLADAADGTAAAHALLVVDVEGGDRLMGLADAHGQVALYLPYPTLTGTLATSPPGETFAPLADQRWQVTVRARYAPEQVSFPFGGTVPELGSVRDQPSANLFATAVGPAVETLTAELAFGRELVLRTAGQPELLIEAGA